MNRRTFIKGGPTVVVAWTLGDLAPPDKFEIAYRTPVNKNLRSYPQFFDISLVRNPLTEMQHINREWENT